VGRCRDERSLLGQFFVSARPQCRLWCWGPWQLRVRLWALPDMNCEAVWDKSRTLCTRTRVVCATFF
jgi:hypothetical protein